MKTRSKVLVVLGIGEWLLAGTCGAFATTAKETSASAIQAIQQASDPSAAVTAYANGVAANHNNPQIYAAYVGKMVELGLPELAYHQAQSLTTMQSDNGLGWGVVAYVDARRGQMPDAISAIVLACQFAPESAFIQRTAGEISAWYDLKADKSTLPDTTKDAMSKVRGQVEDRTAFTDAYTTATKAYQSNNNTTEPSQGPVGSSSPSVQPQGYFYAGANDQYAPASYDPNYGYDSGPGWVATAPWWWWQPTGFFGGCDFFPFAPVIVFGHHGFFDHHFHDRNGFFAHGDHFFHDTHHGGRFFGSPSRALFAARASDSFHGAPAPTVRNFSPMTTSRTLNTDPRMSVNRSFSRQMPATRTWNSPAFANRTWMTPQRGWTSPTYRSPAFAARRPGGFSGGVRSGGSPGFRGGGGFHAGGGFGDGHGGGGHR